jgi:excinuclease ABC subunit C
VRRRALLTHFGSLRRIRQASVEELAVVKGMNRDLAAEVRRYLDTLSALLDSEERAEAAEGAASGAEIPANDKQLDLALAEEP